MNLTSYYSPFYLIITAIFTSGWISTYFFRKQLLISLLSLELLVLSIFLGLTHLIIVTSNPIALSFYLLVLGACEATLGLCLLVTFVRILGNDILNNIEIVNC